jgi:hypothetical protein
MRQDTTLVGDFVVARRWGWKTALIVLAVVAVSTLLAVTFSGSSGKVNANLLGAAPTPPLDGPDAVGGALPAVKAGQFRDWPNQRPEIVLLLTGQQHGYLNPCGCSSPQYGGLPRRYNLIQELKDRGWPVLGVDLGDVIEPAGHRSPQTLLKYETSMKALDKMGYAGVAVGLHETEMPFLAALGQFALNWPNPRVLAANLENKKNNFAGAVDGFVVKSAPGSSLNVGVVGIVGHSLNQKISAQKQNPPLLFAATDAALRAALKEMQPKKPELLVLLYHGTQAEAKACAGAFRQFHVVLCQSKDADPSDKPELVNDTLVVNVGHKGRYVGLVGAWRTGKANRPFDLKYQLIMLGPEYETKKGEEAKNPVQGLLEDYAKEVKNGNYLAQYPRRKHPLQVVYPMAQYVGSEACKKCHKHAYEVWEKHKHSHAYDTLVNATRPALRQFDGECVICHTVGFSYDSGYEDEKKTPKLFHVGCESCHGPGSEHVDFGKRTPKQMLDLMNPLRHDPNENEQQRQQRLLKIDLDCQKCHDTENDVHWNFQKKWPSVIHHTPKNNPPPAAGAPKNDEQPRLVPLPETPARTGPAFSERPPAATRPRRRRLLAA